MSKHRFELFSDGVFAIVLTLLVLDLRVPAAHGVQALAEVWPSLLVHTGSFVLVGVLWMVHQGGLERVTAFSVAGIRWNLVCLFWPTLIPFGAKNAAERPLEPLGPSLLAASTGFFILSMIVLRLTLHSTMDDTPELRRWRNRSLTRFFVLALMDLIAAGLSWIAPIVGYLAVAAVVGWVLIAPHPSGAGRTPGVGAGGDG